MMIKLPYLLSRRGEGAWYAYAATTTHENVERFFINQIKAYKVKGHYAPCAEGMPRCDLQVKFLDGFRYWHSDFKNIYWGLMKKAHAEMRAEARAK